MPEKFIAAFIDFLPNQPKNDETRERFRQMLRERFEGRLADAVERIWELPPMAVKMTTTEPDKTLPPPRQDVYVALLLEARDLFVAGHFYACVAMCGIVAERLVKDMFRASVLVDIKGKTERPSDGAFDQLERVEVSGLTRFLNESHLLSNAAAKAAKDLGELRNGYAHARGKNPPADAREAVRLLDALVTVTVSVMKNLGLPAEPPDGGPSEVQ